MKYFTDDFRFNAILCDQNKLPEISEVSHLEYTTDDIVSWMNAGEDNAAVLIGSNDDVFGEQTYDPPIFVARTANPEFFYASNHPPIDPDDVIVEGEGLPETLRDATIEYYE